MCILLTAAFDIANPCLADDNECKNDTLAFCVPFGAEYTCVCQFIGISNQQPVWDDTTNKCVYTNGGKVYMAPEFFYDLTVT